ncbi:MAG: transcriptional repressor NrdR [Clostridia bacterium]|nr:transcriptional repressor NrdR [Clostridia bacterium]
MKCVFCGKPGSKVNETRMCDNGFAIRRRRECPFCKKRFTTYEKMDSMQIYIVKKDGRRELFDLDKVKMGMIKSCEKRPVPIKKIEDCVERIWQQVLQKGNREISSDEVGTYVMEELKRLDLVAYVRFASVYMRFQDIESFKSEVDKLMREKPE